MPAQTMETAAPAETGAAQQGRLRLFNTWTRRVQVFEPVHPGKVGYYACGPTVYNFAHIGNLRTYIFSDLLRRVLEAEGYEVTHVMNITDVGHLTSDADEGEDRMEKGARREGRSAWEIAAHYTDVFKSDLHLLQIKQPQVWCRATDYIPQMIALVQQIERNGFAYCTSDGIYFDTSKVPDYGRLARLDMAGQQARARIGTNDEKRNPQDFALWKFSPPGEQRQMEWDSPWGRGFPGWHIECSAMSAQHLGVPFDIHSGGVDHVPVHHTNEIAQTYAATGKLLANWWMHGEFLVLKDRRMGKSEGNLITLQTLIDQGVDPLAYRYLTYLAHYRGPLSFTDEALASATSALKRLQGIFAGLPVDETAAPHAEMMLAFRNALRDDLNAPKAVAVAWKLVNDAGVDAATQRATLLAMNAILPLGLETVAPAVKEDDTVPAEVLSLVEQRQEARRTRDFARSDAIRAQIAGLGFEVRDTAGGPEIKKL